MRKKRPAERKTKRKEKRKQKYNHEIVMSKNGVRIIGLILLPNVSVPQGTPRFYEFDLQYESVPEDKIPITAEVKSESCFRLVQPYMW